MKITYYICCLLIVASIGGCSKSGGDNGGNTYSIRGLSDVYVRQYADTSFSVLYHVNHPTDLYEPVTFSIDDLPPGITATPRVVTDTTSFSVQVSYLIRMSAAASFPVKLTLYAGSIGKKIFTFNVIASANAAFSYRLIPPADVRIPLYADTILRLPVSAAYVAGIAEPVSISADELPAGVTVSPSAVSGVPSFTDTLSFHITANAQGSFPVTLHGHTSQGAMAAKFNIAIEPGSDCAAPLTGNYTANTVCASYSGVGTGPGVSVVSAAGANKLQILLPFANATADVNCAAATMNVQPSINGGFVFAGGTGHFNANTIVLQYALSGTVNSACTTTLTR